MNIIKFQFLNLRIIFRIILFKMIHVIRKNTRFILQNRIFLLCNAYNVAKEYGTLKDNKF